MTYLLQSEIGENQVMGTRVAQCAASEGIAQPDLWAGTYRRMWAAAPGWDAAWASALALHEDNPSYDPGADEAVITDAMILSQVQAMPPTLPETPPPGTL